MITGGQFELLGAYYPSDSDVLFFKLKTTEVLSCQMTIRGTNPIFRPVNVEIGPENSLITLELYILQTRFAQYSILDKSMAL